MERIEKGWFGGGNVYISTDKGGQYHRPLEFFPILKEATDEQRNSYKINKFGDAIRWADIDEDIHISSFYETSEPDLKNNVIAEIFARFPQLNVSEVARTIGIHKSLLSKYIYGTKKPSAKRTEEIIEAIRHIGRELAAIWKWKRREITEM